MTDKSTTGLDFCWLLEQNSKSRFFFWEVYSFLSLCFPVLSSVLKIVTPGDVGESETVTEILNCFSESANQQSGFKQISQ